MSAYQLDPDVIEDEGRMAGALLSQGKPYGLLYTPGNGTLYELVLTPARGIHALGGIPEGFAEDRDVVVVVAVLNMGGAHGFRMLGRAEAPAPDYIAEKLNVRPADGEALRQLFSAIGRHS